MKKFIIAMRKKSGYISIETVIVAGLIIGLGALLLTDFSISAKSVVSGAMDQVATVQDVVDGWDRVQIAN